MNTQQRKQTQFSIVYILVAGLLVWLFQALIFGPLLRQQQEVPYNQFRQDLSEGKIEEVTLEPTLIIYTTKPEENKSQSSADRPGDESWGALLDSLLNEPEPSQAVHNTVPVEDPELVPDLLAAGVTFRAKAPSSGLLTTLLGWVIPFLPLALIGYFMFRRMGQAGQGIMSFGKSKAQEITGQQTGITFKDVGGVDEVEVELKEIIEFIKAPDHFTQMGAKLPTGILLVGPPGTGKTLLAKATAGEADVPFFSISGSYFVEMFVGVGAARVRDLFDQAEVKAPCLVFIDEIDAIGQSRSTVGALQSHDEREQTLNQLLAEMDGFEANQGVVIMAASNRPEVLDKALLRPGRFDRQIEVPLPTERGRRQILSIHTRTVPLAADADLDRLAKITSGFSGADLANIVNEAALLAVRRDSQEVTMADFDLAIERVVAGLQRTMPLRDEVRRKVAYHEGGHALVAELLPDTDQVHKVSIIPTSKGALGYTMQMPEEDEYLVGLNKLKQRLAVMLGGRAAELLIFAEPSTGALNDLERVTDLARRMVTEFGMSESLGPVRYVTGVGMGYLGRQADMRPLSPETETLIDQEIRDLIDGAQARALDLLRTHEAALHEIADILQEHEVISGDEVRRIAQRSAELANQQEQGKVALA